MFDVEKLAEQMVMGAAAYIDKKMVAIERRIDALELREAGLDIKASIEALGQNLREEVKELIPNAEAIAALVRESEPLAASLSEDDVAEITRGVIGVELEQIRAAIPSEDAIAELARDVATSVVSDLPKPENGMDGKSVTVEDVAPMIEAEIEKRFAVIRVPKDGEPGKDADPNEVAGLVREMISEDMAALRESIASEIKNEIPELPDIPAMIDDAVATALSNLPTPKDGVGLAGAHIDRDGILTLTMTDGKQVPLGKVQGADGVGFDDIKTFFREDERTLVIQFMKGDRTLEFEHELSIPIHRGVWRDGSEYRKGDNVTFGGSTWIALKHEPEGKPGFGGEWMLITKKGKDGRDGDKVGKS